MIRTCDTLKPHKWNSVIFGNEPLDQSFVASIKESGVLVPLTIKTNGTIVSGHRRWRAAMAAGLVDVPVKVEEYESEEEERRAFVNYNRQREKTFSQKMREAAFIEETERLAAKRRQGIRTDIVENFPQCEQGKSRDKVAEQSGIGSGRQYEKAKKVWAAAEAGNENAVKVVECLDRGKATIHSAYKKVTSKEPPLSVAPPKGEYDIILADPPWKYEFAETTMRAVENHYPTMDLVQIKNLKIPSADNAVLLLWTPAPKLEEALDVMQAWGFKYRTNAVWDKEIIGMGYWFRSQHELLLVGVKGEYHPPLPEHRDSSVIRERRREHSKKPVAIHKIIEKMFPSGKYIELFARDRREGWEVWGNEV